MKTIISKLNTNKIDWFLVIFPLLSIIMICCIFSIYPQQSNLFISKTRFLFCNKFGSFYLIVGLGIFLTSLYLVFSQYGNIKLGNPESKPKYSFFAWGSMMFTCGLAADILFYSFSEWIMYAKDITHLPHNYIPNLNSIYPIFHWSLIPWGFYLVLASAFGFMIHVRHRNRKKYSEACRPILGKNIGYFSGKIIDLIAVFALVAGTATTFSIATPLMTDIISKLTSLDIEAKYLTILIIIATCFIYTYTLLHGFKYISILAQTCIYSFISLIFYVFIFGGESDFIIENGFTSIGGMIQNFFTLATYTDAERNNFFPQNWTIYYWAYWMVWCVAVPFFIGKISEGRTIKQLITGGYIFGIGSTIISFIVFGNYSLSLQLSGKADFITMYNQENNIYNIIINIISTLPYPNIFLYIMLFNMITFYATSFDSIAYTAACYSHYTLKGFQKPHKLIQFIWCILLIFLPISLVFSQSSIQNLQSISIIAAFPISLIIILITVSFFKDANKYLYLQHKNNN